MTDKCSRCGFSAKDLKRHDTKMAKLATQLERERIRKAIEELRLINTHNGLPFGNLVEKVNNSVIDKILIILDKED